MNKSQIIDEMLAAISANIEYLKKNGNSQIRIKDGKFVSAIDGNYIYEFMLDYLQEIDSDIEIEVKMFNRSYSGRVVSVKGQTIQIAVDQHIGDTLSSATLIISNYFLLEKLHEQLSKLKADGVTKSSMLEKTFALKESVIREDITFTPKLERMLNEYQEKAIRTVLGSEITYLWGPPGTGKSKTIAALLEELVDRGKSVLLIAHTNAATDSVLKKVIEVMEHHSAYTDGKIIRIGSPKSIDEDIQNTMVMPEIVVEEKSKPFREEIRRLNIEQIENSQKLEQFKELNVALDNIEYSKAKIAQIEIAVRAKSGEIEDITSRLLSMSSVLEKINKMIADHQDKGTFGRMFSGTSIDKLTTQKGQALTAISNNKNSLDALRTAKISLENEFSVHEENITKLANFIDRTHLSYSKKLSEKYTQRQKYISEQIHALEKQIAMLEEMLIQDAQVIVTTLTKSYMHGGILERKFDCVILDEASMAPLPAIASVSESSSEKFVLVGDFLQLPPIAQHDVDPTNKTEEEADREQALIDNWLKRDIFTAVGIEQDVRAGKELSRNWMVQLKRQYRMHPDISDVINKLVYGKNGSDRYTLEDGEDTYKNGASTLDALPLSGAHIGIYDTSSMGTVPIKAESGSTYNLTHALIAVKLAKEALENGTKDVGIISSYRAQVNLLNKIILDEVPDNDGRIMADTVHRFQGGDRDLIIFDVTTPNTNTMYDDLKEDGDDAKLINVAFSRAKNKCILLVDKEAVLKKHSDSSLIRKSIGMLAEKNRPTLDANEMLDHYKADDRTEHWLEKLHNVRDIEGEVRNSQLFDERDFYSYFQKDLLDAEQEVIIESAFLTINRINSLLPIFRHIMNKGVRIFVLTRLPREQSGTMVSQSSEGLKILELNGVVVIPLSGKIHQKFGVIDRNLMWEGSLNILSQRDSSETMRRIKGEATVSQFLEFHKLDKNLGPLGSNNLKHCEVCTQPGAWYWSKKTRFGVWTFCLAGNHSPGKPPKTDDDRKDYQLKKEASVQNTAKLRKSIKLNSSNQLICPVHDRVMQPKTGRFGEYWECALVKECGCRANKKQLSHLF